MRCSTVHHEGRRLLFSESFACENNVLSRVHLLFGTVSTTGVPPVLTVGFGTHRRVIGLLAILMATVVAMVMVVVVVSAGLEILVLSLLGAVRVVVVVPVVTAMMVVSSMVVFRDILIAFLAFVTVVDVMGASVVVAMMTTVVMTSGLLFLAVLVVFGAAPHRSVLLILRLVVMTVMATVAVVSAGSLLGIFIGNFVVTMASVVMTNLGIDVFDFAVVVVAAKRFSRELLIVMVPLVMVVMTAMVMTRSGKRSVHRS